MPYIFDNGHGYDAYLNFIKKYPEAKETFKTYAQLYQTKPKDGVFADGKEIIKFSDYLRQHAFLLKGMTSSDINHLSDIQADILAYLNGSPMFAGWRNSLDIYQIDENIFEEMIKSPIPEDTPCEIFKRLPSFCVYVEFPREVRYSEFLDEAIVGDLVIKGFWAYLAYEGVTEEKVLQLNICADTASNVYRNNFDYLSLIIEEGMTVKQASERIFNQYIGFPDENSRLTTAKNDQKALYCFLPILLWLCAEEPDISNIKNEPVSSIELRQPKYSIHKKTGAFIPPSHPTVYQLGQRLGGEIRQYEELIKRDKSIRPTATKRPHIRKGHWHGYWVGKMGSRVFEVRWVAATFVGI